MTDPLLQIKNLSVDFATDQGQLHAVRNASFNVGQGKIIGLVGESGCGKSTLASAVIRLMDDNATVRADGIVFEKENLMDLSSEKMRAMLGEKISMIFQNPMTALNPVLSIGTQMTDIQHRKKLSRAQKREAAAAMLGKVGIPDPLERLAQFPHEFSGGMRQRICIAMALLSRPALIIADEPTTALDVTMEAQIVHLLKELQQEMGCAIICVSHHLGMIAELCHEVVVMYAGQIIEQGEIRDIFKSAAHPYTRCLLACDPANIKESPGHLPTIKGEIPNLIQLPQGCIFYDRCPERLDLCAERSPVPEPLKKGHWAACHLISKGRLS